MKFKERWSKAQSTIINEFKNIDDDEISSQKINETPLWKRPNKEGFTPLKLAAKLGLTEMFSFLLDECKIVQWCYGPVSCVLYPLEELELESQDEVSL